MGIGVLLIAFVILLISYTFDMNQVDDFIEEETEDYWDEYWREEDEDDGIL